MMNNTTTSAVPHRANARAIGLLFLLPFFAYGIGSALLAPVMAGSPAEVAAHPSRLLAGTMLLLLNSLFVMLIGVLSFPVLMQHSRAMAIGYLATRLVEGLTLIVGIVALAGLAPTRGVVVSDGQQELLHVIAVKASFWSYQFAMLMLALGSLPFCWVLLRRRLAPAGIAVWGIAGYALFAVGILLDCFGSSVGLLLSIPGGLFELAFGIWLMAKGFVPQRKVSAAPQPSVS
jgi:hypothetical protein